MCRNTSSPSSRNCPGRAWPAEVTRTSHGPACSVRSARAWTTACWSETSAAAVRTIAPRRASESAAALSRSRSRAISDTEAPRPASAAAVASQIPTGVLVDRYGPRRVLIAAVLFLGLGQILLGVAHTFGLGLLARGILGFGDALTFVSVLRLVAVHFPARQYTVVATLTSATGYVGNLLATVPLTLLLGSAGWTPTFIAVGVITVLYSVVVALRVRDVPAGMPAPVREQVPPRVLARRVAEAWRVPGTRLGFWVHFSTMFAPNVLALLWGMPFLVQGQGLPAATASALLTVFVFGSMLGGPLLGGFIARHPTPRTPLVGAYLGGAAVVWAVLLGWNGPLPIPLLVV